MNEGDQRVPLWNRLYIPLVAAATGSFVITHFTDLDMSLGLPADDFGGVAEVFVAIGVAMVAAAV
ncbi:ion channel protein, partial [Streptomyces sp. SID10244]|nr:ion channel protein [Streptomyces sp. SID10244]